MLSQCRAGPITDNDLNVGVAAKPVGKHLGCAIVEKIDGPVRLEVEQ